jgi:hypothetical protein
MVSSCFSGCLSNPLYAAAPNCPERLSRSFGRGGVSTRPCNALLNVDRPEDGCEHASSKLKDVFDAMGLALTEARTDPVWSMDVLSAAWDEGVDPSVPTPEGSGSEGRVGLR